MSRHLFSWVWLGLFVAISIVRKAHERRAGKRSSLRDTPTPEAVLMILWGLAAGVVPLIYLFSDWLTAVDYPFAMPLPLSLFGVALFVAAIWLLHRAHTDLGHLWSPTVAPDHGQQLVTDGVFRYVRHPMYSAHLLWGFAQVLLLPNLVAGPPALMLMLMLVAVRVAREERALLDEFGETYRQYRARTGAIVPRLRSTR